MKVYKGVSASPGLVLGQVSRLEHHVETFSHGPFNPERELRLLANAVHTAQNELDSMADLAALHAKPGSLFFLAIMSQLAHALEQLVVFRTPGVVVQRISRKYGIHAGSRFNVRVIRIIRFYWHYFKTIQFPFCHPGAKHFVF